MNYRCSHGSRENANEYFGTETGLWGITAGVYLASMGPVGMYELGGDHPSECKLRHPEVVGGSWNPGECVPEQ
mgnify:CR=1 FL=1